MKKYPCGYTYTQILNMDYLLYLDHIHYLDCIEAEDNLTKMRIQDNHLWLETNQKNNFNSLYNYFENITKKVKDIKKINLFNPKQLDGLFGKYKAPKKRGEKK